jgi:uncharacterized protein YrrD
MTTYSMKAKQGQAVVTVDTAEDIGSLKHFVVSQAADRIERLHIDGRSSKASFVEWNDLESFGPDRVMVSSADAPRHSDDDRDIEAARGKVELIGSRVLTTAGFEEGEVEDAEFDAETGAIVSMTTTTGRSIEAAAVHSLGSYALVVDP